MEFNYNYMDTLRENVVIMFSVSFSLQFLYGRTGQERGPGPKTEVRFQVRSSIRQYYATKGE